MASVLRPSSLLSFPQRMPGFNPNHVASPSALAGLGFSWVASIGGTVGTLVQTPHTIPSLVLVGGAASRVAHGIIGTCSKFTAQSTGIAFTGQPTTTFGNVTIALIAAFTAVGNTDLVATSNGNNGYELALTSGSVMELVVGGGAGTLVSSGLAALTTNTPYFMVCSAKNGGGADTVNFLLLNLANGKILTAAVTGAGWTNPVQGGTGCIGTDANTPFNNANGFYAAAMASQNYMSMPQLRMWAADPWAFWYPYTELRSLNWLSSSQLTLLPGAPFDLFFEPVKLKRSSPSWVDTYGKMIIPAGGNTDPFFEPVKLKRPQDSPQLPVSVPPPQVAPDKPFDPPAKLKQPPDWTPISYGQMIIPGEPLEPLFEPGKLLKQPRQSDQLAFGTQPPSSIPGFNTDPFFESIRLKKAQDAPQLSFAAPPANLVFDRFFDPSRKLRQPADWPQLVVTIAAPNIVLSQFDGPQKLKASAADWPFVSAAPSAAPVTATILATTFDGSVRRIVPIQWTDLPVSVAPPVTPPTIGLPFESPARLLKDRTGFWWLVPYGTQAAAPPATGGLIQQPFINSMVSWMWLRGSGSSSSGATLDPATTAWIAAVIANGGTVSGTEQGYVDTLIKGLKTDGVWTKLDRLWLYASENTFQALTDIVADSLSTAHGSPTFTANTGYTGVAGSTTVYIDTGFNPSLGANFVRNSAHMSVWAVTGGSGLNNRYLAGDNAGSEITVISETVSGPTVAFCCTDGSGPIGVNAIANTGHFLMQRTAPTTVTLYQNGNNSLGVNSDASAPLNNQNMFALAINNFGTANSGTGEQLAMLSFGSSLTLTDISNFYTRLRTYMTSVGVP